MKKTALLSLLTISSIVSCAQFPEDFNTKCATASTPWGWLVNNPIPGTAAQGSWVCTATNGKPVTTGGTPTPGVQCSGYYSGTNHLDTSYLISPLINTLTSTNYPGGKVYMRFDTKKDNILNGARIDLRKLIVDSISGNPLSDSIVGSGMVTPNFGDEDATDWVTHEVDLTQYLNAPPFYMGFRYVSTTATGTIWYMDNIFITPFSLSVEQQYTNKQALPIFVIGGGTSSQISLSYTTHDAGTYHVAIYDMMGRNVHASDVDATRGTASYTISGLSLRPGMYCVKMGNKYTYGTTKLMIQ
jgi:hypothetical protein